MNPHQTTQSQINHLSNSLVEIRRNIMEIVRRTPSNSSLEFYLSHDQRYVIELYTNMYTNTLRQIDFLYQELYLHRSAGDARHRPRSRPPNNTDFNYSSQRFNSSTRPLYVPPPPREAWGRDINSLFTEAIRNFTSPDLTPVRVNPTAEQILCATRRIRFGDVTDPPNARCPIRLEPFEQDTMVTQIIHCRHCFHSEECERWFQNSVRCPVCRYDIRTGQVASSAHAPGSEEGETAHENDDAEEVNRWYYEEGQDVETTRPPNSVADLLTQTIGNLMTNTNTQEFTFDASNSMIIYDAIFRGRS